jgi:hypothetical protein
MRDHVRRLAALTVLFIYGLWVLLQQETERMFV